jgi:hypothetical protein
VFHITGARISQCDCLHIENGIHFYTRNWLGHAVAQLVEAVRYKPEGRGFDSDGVIGIFYSSGRAMALGLTQPLIEMSTRNISPGVKAAGAPSCADCLEIWKSQRP